MQPLLTDAGFDCTRVDRGGVANLFARWGARAANKTFGFNGHTDVVPVGNRDAWTQNPFGAAIIDGWMYGRGATDMKSGVAAFVSAAIDFVRDTPPDGAVILTITGDEEGEATDGTLALLDWMAAQGEHMTHCLVAEPTCPEQLGDMMKIGRRGSLVAHITATGVQGHSAYPQRARNPLHALVRLLDGLASAPLDQGTPHFDASSLAITTIDCGNPAANVIPAEACATLNIRFNDLHTGEGLITHLHAATERVRQDTGVGFTLRTHISGESFITPPGDFSALIARAVAAEIGRTPEPSTSGGTSDARFIRKICPVVEFGLVGKTMHQVDERVELTQIAGLKAIYTRILRDYFA